jgi:hypothetical protein
VSPRTVQTQTLRSVWKLQISYSIRHRIEISLYDEMMSVKANSSRVGMIILKISALIQQNSKLRLTFPSPKSAVCFPGFLQAEKVLQSSVGITFGVPTGVCEISTLVDSGLFLHAATPFPGFQSCGIAAPHQRTKKCIYFVDGLQSLCACP